MLTFALPRPVCSVFSPRGCLICAVVLCCSPCAHLCCCVLGPVHPNMAFLPTGITSAKSASTRSRATTSPWEMILHNLRRKWDVLWRGSRSHLATFQVVKWKKEGDTHIKIASEAQGFWMKWNFKCFVYINIGDFNLR